MKDQILDFIEKCRSRHLNLNNCLSKGFDCPEKLDISKLQHHDRELVTKALQAQKTKPLTFKKDIRPVINRLISECEGPKCLVDFRRIPLILEELQWFFPEMTDSQSEKARHFMLKLKEAAVQ